MSPAHVTLTLNLWDENLEEEVPVEVDYLMDRTLDVGDFDLEEAIVLEEMGYETSPILGIVRALEKYEKDFFDALKKVKPRTKLTAEQTARLVSKILFKRFFEGTDSDESDWDAQEAHYAILGEDEYVRQGILLLKDRIAEEQAGKRFYGKGESGEIAQMLEPYLIEPDHMEVEVRHQGYRDVYDPNVMSWNNILDARYCLVISDIEVACWSRTLEFRIYDPVGFNGEVVDWGEEWGIEEAKLPDNVSGVLNELGLDEPELEDPEPPDYPMKATASDPHPWFGVLYEIDQTAFLSLSQSESKRFGKPVEYTVVPYDTLFHATEAKELSETIVEHEGDSPIRAMWLVREKSADERREDELLERQGVLFEFEDPPEWTKDWVILEDED